MSEPAQVAFRITSINVCYRPHQLEVRFMTNAPPSRPPPPEIDPDYVLLQFAPINDELPEHGGSLTIRKDDAKRLDLMVGDVVKVTVSKS